jgi:hypothetical protein
MPIEIRELIIKTTIDNDSYSQNKSNNSNLEGHTEKQKKRLLEECKQYINQVVKEIKER